MKTPHLIVLLSALGCSPLFSRAQENDDQFLAKYSYPIFIVTGNKQHTSTAFFYRSGDSSYLVSNYHAIKGMSPLKQTITFRADTLYLKYPVKDTDESKIMAIDIQESVTGATEIFSMVDRIDLFKIPVEIPEDAGILFINDLVEERYLDAEPEEVLVFGYPTHQGKVPAFYSRQQRLEGWVNPNGFDDYDASIQLNSPASSDSARAILGGTAHYYYFIKPYVPQGFSGAPVFGKFRTEEDEIIYRFCGVIFAGQPSTRQTWAIRAAIALQYLQGE